MRKGRNLGATEHSPASILLASLCLMRWLPVFSKKGTFNFSGLGCLYIVPIYYGWQGFSIGLGGILYMSGIGERQGSATGSKITRSIDRQRM